MLCSDNSPCRHTPPLLINQLTAVIAQNSPTRRWLQVQQQRSPVSNHRALQGCGCPSGLQGAASSGGGGWSHVKPPTPWAILLTPHAVLACQLHSRPCLTPLAEACRPLAPCWTWRPDPPAGPCPRSAHPATWTHTWAPDAEGPAAPLERSHRRPTLSDPPGKAQCRAGVLGPSGRPPRPQPKRGLLPGQAPGAPSRKSPWNQGPVAWALPGPPQPPPQGQGLLPPSPQPSEEGQKLPRSPSARLSRRAPCVVATSASLLG